VDVSLFLTSACTLRCVYCYAHGGDAPRQMPFEMVKVVAQCIVTNARATGRRTVWVNFHGGGDIGAAWDLFCRSCEHIREETEKAGLNVRFALGTNGILDPKQREWVARHIQSATVSLDGPAHIQDAQLPTVFSGDSFRCVDETLRTFDQADMQYGIRCTVTGQSVSELQRIIEFMCQRYGARHIKAEPLWLSGRARSSGHRPPQPEEFVAQFRRAREVANRYGRQLTYSGARLETVTDFFCKAAAGSCCITPEGYLTSCYEVVDRSNPLADTFIYGRLDLEAGAFVVDWHRLDRLRAMRFSHSAFCVDCFCKWHCAGECPVKRLSYDQTGARPDPDRCYVTREITKDQLVELAHR
jgi:uncharacterized protein